jgi:hypothetical protein
MQEHIVPQADIRAFEFPLTGTQHTLSRRRIDISRESFFIRLMFTRGKCVRVLSTSQAMKVRIGQQSIDMLKQST